MKWFRALLFLCILAPAGLFGQGVRMSADFMPLAVGNRWVYDVVNVDGRKISEVEFSVREHTIVKGRSFYVLTQFPFTPSGSDIHLVRYDKTEKQFLRILDDVEDVLFLNDGTTAEVVEADKSGLPQKFVLHSGVMDVTFQRGVGIVEVKTQGQIAKIASARVGEGIGFDAAASNKGPSVSAPGAPATNNPSRPPGAAQQAGIPLPKTAEQKVKEQAAHVGSITDDNPFLSLDAGEVPEGHKLVLIVKNISDKLLPFVFTSGQSYDFAIIDPATGQEIWRWSQHMFFVTQMRKTEAIPPNGQWKFEAVWNHRDNNLNPVPPGTYQLVAFVTTKPVIESDSITIEIKVK